MSSKSDAVLEALLDEVQALRSEISKLWNKVNSVQAGMLEMDSRQREMAKRLGELMPSETE